MLIITIFPFLHKRRLRLLPSRIIPSATIGTKILLHTPTINLREWHGQNQIIIDFARMIEQLKRRHHNIISRFEINRIFIRHHPPLQRRYHMQLRYLLQLGNPPQHLLQHQLHIPQFLHPLLPLPQLHILIDTHIDENQRDCEIVDFVAEIRIDVVGELE